MNGQAGMCKTFLPNVPNLLIPMIDEITGQLGIQVWDNCNTKIDEMWFSTEEKRDIAWDKLKESIDTSHKIWQDEQNSQS